MKILSAFLLILSVLASMFGAMDSAIYGALCAIWMLLASDKL